MAQRRNDRLVTEPGVGVAARRATAITAASEGRADGWEALFWLVFNRSRNPIVVVDEQQRLLEINEAGAALFGGSRGDLLGTTLVDSFAQRDRSAAARDWPNLLRRGERVGTRVIVRPDGTSVEVDWAARVARVGGRRIVIAVMLGMTPPSRRGRGGGQTKALTPREREVVTLIALGHDTGEIAAALVISPETVKSHVRSAMSKSRAHTRAQLVARALGTGEIAPVPGLDR